MVRSAADMDALVSDLYLSAADPEAVARLPVALSRIVGGTVGALWSLDPATNAVVEEPVTNLPTEAVERYKQCFYAHDPFSRAVLVGRRDVAFHGGEHVNDASYLQSVYYNEFAKEHGMFHMVGALVTLGSEARLGVVSILRPRSQGEFSADATERLDHLMPHIKGALQLRVQLAAARQATNLAATQDLLEMLGMPALVLDGHGHVVQANRRAEDLPCIRAALARPARNLGLQGAESLTSRRLLAAAAGAASGGPGATVLADLDGRTYFASITPLPVSLAPFISHAGRPGRVLLVMRPLDLGDQAEAMQRVMALFGLTVAEAAVAMALARGLAPDQIAAERQVKVSTVRTLLTRAQHKVSSPNLRDLVRVLTLSQA